MVAGDPVWLELASTDPARSLEFYAGLLGWRPSAPAEGGPTRVKLGRAAIADVVASDVDGWLVFFGGLPGEVPGVLTDPSGARVGIADPAHPGFGARNVPGAPAWFELHTLDFAAAVPFYVETLDWDPVSLGDSDAFRMIVNGDPATATAGVYDAARDDLDDVSAWMPYFAVKDADLAAGRVRELGGAMLDEPVDTPFGRMAHATDPLGTLFTLIRLPKEA
jgi:uncharacterized protein